MLFFIFFFLPLLHCQTIKQLNEIIIKEELPIGSVVTPLIDKIPNLEQSVEYDLVTPLSSELDLFSIDHTRHTLNIKKRLDYEAICSKKSSCLLSISIAVSNHDTIDVYILPIQLKNIDDNPLKFPVNRTVIEIEENDEHWSTRTYSLPSAIDADGDKITYSLFLQNWTQVDGLFEFNEQNFLLKPLRQFDREEENLYSLRFVARNEHQQEISMDILVLIKDQNDNPPKCPNHPMLFSIDTIETISIFHLNVTDLDEGENGRLEYQFIEPISGFNIDRDRGEISFHYPNWIRGNSSKLSIQVTDHGQPARLSTVCLVEYQLTSLLDIHFQFNPIIHIDTVNTGIGKLKLLDKQTQRSCIDCVIHWHSSWNDLFIFNETTKELLVNFQSMILVRILSNRLIGEENLPVMMEISGWDRMNPAIISRKNVSLMLNFNKEKFFYKTKILFLQIPETLLLNGSISLLTFTHSCLNNQLKTWQLIDSSNTFDLTSQFHLTLKKSSHIHLQSNYQLFLQTNSCSIELRLFIVKAYSPINVHPYFPQAFYILTSSNLSSFILPTLPSHVKYISSNPNDIAIEQANGSLTIRSSTLYSTYAYDFQIEAIDSQTPSLSCTIPVRLFFGMNKQSIRLIDNQTQRSLEISSEDFIYQIDAYDPDLEMISNRNSSLSPTIEYQIDPAEDVDIERYTGRIYFKNVNRSKYDFVVTMMDFGQPNRLLTRQRFTFDIKSVRTIHRQEISMFISRTLMFIIAGIFVVLISVALIIILFNACSSRSSNTKSLSNLSPTTPDCRLIDNEYVSVSKTIGRESLLVSFQITTTTSLPRVIIREQRIYPTMSNDHIPPLPTYSSEKISIQKDYPPSLSINDINKYLERFEKIYNNSSDQHFREPVGSVV